ncbi:MAG: AMP-binding protein [Cyclobacteriaceae bacterium]|nr:AMP-binding protein [Cyclobacteriaceae bacterium]
MEEYTWFNFYPRGIPREINPDKYKTLNDMFDECFRKYRDLIAYENIGSHISFRLLDKLSLNFAKYLQNDLGMKKGDRIAIQMPNLMQYPVVIIGALRAGLIIVNTNPLYTPREMEHQFRDSGARAIVILENFAANLQKIIKNTSIEYVIVSKIGDVLGGLKGEIVNMVVKYVKKMVPAFKIDNAIPFKKTIRTRLDLSFIPPELKSEDYAFLQYTGGTTGISKGAILSHRNMIANMEQISAWMVPKLLEREETMITALPLYHIFALTVNCLAMLKIGAKNILITNPRDMPAFVKELKKQPFTVMTGVNTLFNALLNQPDFVKLDFSRFKVAVGGGMAVQKSVAQRWEKVTGLGLVEGYGLSETAPVLTCNPIDGSERIGTIGIPLPSTHIRVLDDEGREVETGLPGEICAKGPQVMSGYWEKADETGEVFIDGWFKTGDIGVIDEDGFFRIVDRKKEMINVSGFNVYPNEIEDVVASHPKVLEVGVVGIPDERSNEIVRCYIVKKDESLSEEEIIDYCRDKLTAYKRPKSIIFKKELPKSNIGKILRRILREEALQKLEN